MSRIILASNSPRRKELLENLGVKFDIIVSDVEEKTDLNAAPHEIAMNLAYLKAKDVSNNVKDDAIVIAADTIVVKEKILGKPCDEKEAFNMLKSLSGGVHEVITGIAVIANYKDKEILDYVSTKVYFKSISDQWILNYIRTGEPMDKAGAYGIQGKAALFIEKIDGDYYNVVGLPVSRLAVILQNHFNVHLL